MTRLIQGNDPGEDHTILCGRDKSLTHRAVMFGALSQGRTVISKPLLGADCLSTMACFRALGVAIDRSAEGTITVESQGSKNFTSPPIDLDCGNSGTTARLMLGILASQAGLHCRMVGDESLSQRPMHRVVKPLRAMGAQISGRDDGNFLPLSIEGKALGAIHHDIDKASAQIKSCLLLAGLFCEGETSVKLPKGGRDHTERVLVNMGASLHVNTDEVFETIRLKGPFQPKASRFTIPVDPSSAAFFAVLGLLRSAGRITLPEVLYNPTRIGFLDVLQRMSSALSIESAHQQQFMEEIMTIRISGGHALKASDIAASEVPSLVDEIPILAVAAAFAQGPSHFKGLDELRVKESDRLTETAALLSAAGAEVKVVGNDLLIAGGLKKTKAFRYDCKGDHRLAMAAAVLAFRCSEPCTLLDPDCVEVSFPKFFEVLSPFVR